MRNLNVVKLAGIALIVALALSGKCKDVRYSQVQAPPLQ